jgi:chorismate synthase
MEQQIDEAIEQGDTLGGEFTVVVEGLPAGIGSYTQWDRRMDTLLAAQLMSIPGIKAVQAGMGAGCAALPGSKVHDEILPGSPKRRLTNNAGGMEGGVTNGEPLVLTCSMKPIPTLKQGLRSVDIRTGKAVRAGYERSDCCAVPAASVVGEAAAIIAVSQALLASFGLPNMELLVEAFESHRAYWTSL